MRKGSYLSEEHRKKIGKVLKGKIVSLETRKKMGIANSGKNNSMFGKIPWNKGKECRQLSGKNNGMFGRRHSEVTKQKISKINRGKIPWIKGRRMSDESREKMKLNHPNVFGRNNPFFGKRHSEESKRRITLHWKDKFLRESHIKNIIKASHVKPNKTELKLNSILQNLFPNDYDLNVLGDKLILGGKIPDFVNMNGQKKVIELFGKPFHTNSKFNNYKVPYKKTAKGRKAIFKKLGYGCLVIWDKELKNPIKLEEKIKTFHYGEIT